MSYDGYDGDNVDDFLEHYGVKGMKWGQVKSAASSGASAAAGKVGEAAAATKGAAKVAGREAGAAVKGKAKAAGAELQRQHQLNREVKGQQKQVRKEIKAETKRRVAEADAQLKARDDARYSKTKKDGTVVTAKGRKAVDTFLGSRQALIKADTINQAGYTGGKAAAVAFFRSPHGAKKLRNRNIKAQVAQERRKDTPFDFV